MKNTSFSRIKIYLVLKQFVLRLVFVFLLLLFLNLSTKTARGQHLIDSSDKSTQEETTDTTSSPTSDKSTQEKTTETIKLPREKKFQLGFSFSPSTSNRQYLFNFIDYQENNNQINYSLSLGRDITKSFKISLSTSYVVLQQYRRENDTLAGSSRFSKSYMHDFNAYNLNLTWRVLKEKKYPSLTIGSNITLLKKESYGSETELFNYKNYSFSLSTSHTTDPIVLSLSLSYSVSREKDFSSIKIDRGETITLGPAIYFTVNPFLNLNWGFAYQYTEESKTGIITSNPSYSFSHSLGISYEINEDFSYSINSSQSNGLGSSSTSISIFFSYRF